MFVHVRHMASAAASLLLTVLYALFICSIKRVSSVFGYDVVATLSEMRFIIVVRVSMRPNMVLFFMYAWAARSKSSAPIYAAIVAISSPAAAADSTLPSIIGVISISATVPAALTTASAMHRNMTGLCISHAVCTIYHVFCHILYLGLVFFFSVASIAAAAPLPFSS